MQRKATILTVALIMMAAAPAFAADAESHGCLPTDHVDGSTADQAKRKIQAAGYTEVTDLSKGCDNFWHGHAMKDGAPVNVVLSPPGMVLLEGD
jgi:hypothetical protein